LNSWKKATVAAAVSTGVAGVGTQRKVFVWVIRSSAVSGAKRYPKGFLGGGFKYFLCSSPFGEDFQLV